jgi:hypothetical protein
MYRARFVEIIAVGSIMASTLVMDVQAFSSDPFVAIVSMCASQSLMDCARSIKHIEINVEPAD